MGVVVQFSSTDRPRVERDRMDFTGVELEEKDSCNSVIGCVGFDNDLFSWLPMSKNRCFSEAFVKIIKRFITGLGPFPFDVLACEARKQNNDIGVVVNEASVEITKAKEGLDVLDLPRYRPFQNRFDLILRHFEPFR